VRGGGHRIGFFEQAGAADRLCGGASHGTIATIGRRQIGFLVLDPATALAVVNQNVARGHNLDSAKNKQSPARIFLEGRSLPKFSPASHKPALSLFFNARFVDRGSQLRLSGCVGP
jgi:hypothetical protein